MNTRLLLSSAAILLGLAGLASLFLPAEICSLYSPATDNPPLLLVQLLGAAWLGLASLNWISRSAPAGGIYGRPLTLANLAHFAIGGLLLIRGGMSQSGNLAVWCTLAAYVLFSAAFAMVLFGAPPKHRG